jgi:hypothetical protein
MTGNQYFNTNIIQEDGTKYEINWLTDVAQEVSQRLVNDVKYNIQVALTFKELTSLLRLAPKIIPVPETDKPYLHVCATKHKTKPYLILVNLVPESVGANPRCQLIDYKVITEQDFNKLSGN